MGEFDIYFKVQVGDSVLTNEQLRDITSLTLTKKKMGTDTLQLVLVDNYFEYQYFYEEGTSIFVEFGFLNGERAGFSGEINGLNPTMPESEGDSTGGGDGEKEQKTAGIIGFDSDITLTVECVGELVHGHKEQKQRIFEKQTSSDVVILICKEYGWLPNVEATKEKYNQITQAGETDVELIKRLAKKEGFIFKMVGNNLFFGKEHKGNDIIASFDYRMGNKMVKSFKPSFNKRDRGKDISASTIDSKNGDVLDSIQDNPKEKQGKDGANDLNKKKRVSEEEFKKKGTKKTTKKKTVNKPSSFSDEVKKQLEGLDLG